MNNSLIWGKARCVLFEASLLFLVASCAVQEQVSPRMESRITKEGAFSRILVPKENNLLYVRIPDLESARLSTRSDGSEPMVSLESLLDRDRTMTRDFKNWRVNQIEFKPDESDESVALSDSLTGFAQGFDFNLVKKFLIETIDTLTQERSVFTATMIPTNEYISSRDPSQISYIHKSGFEGIILYGEIDGTFTDVLIYGGFPIQSGSVIRLADTSGCRFVRHLTLFRKSPATRIGDYADSKVVEITGSICVALREDTHSNSETPTIGEVERPVSGVGGGGGTGGGGSGAGSAFGEVKGGTLKAAVKVDSLRREVLKYTVNLYSHGEGSVKGGGTYVEGSLVDCFAEATIHSYFDRWTGDFHDRTEAVCFVINEDVSSTAFFASIISMPEASGLSSLRPCFNRATGIANPLITMAIASTDSANVRIIGGTWGYTRNSGSKWHSGLDLLAIEGTPVYAMVDGIISSKGYVVDQPNRDSNGNYPNGYNGDVNGAGNRVSVETTTSNGDNLIISLWHLQEGTPIAINPRTGRPFAKGDTIYQGELLCFTGKTGNAYNVPNSHLHLRTIRNGKECNPDDIINGDIDWADNTKTSLKNNKIIGIICDADNHFFSILKNDF